MSEYLKPALARLAAEYKAYKGGRHEEIMKGAVREALKRFCKQNGEFAQAVAQGGDFKGCMAAVRKEVHGNAISTQEALTAAAGYYFHGAQVKFWMEIRLEPGEGTDGRAPSDADLRDDREEPDKKAGILIDLADFL